VFKTGGSQPAQRRDPLPPVTRDNFGVFEKFSEVLRRLCTFLRDPENAGKHFSKPIEQIVEEADRRPQAVCG